MLIGEKPPDPHMTRCSKNSKVETTKGEAGKRLDPQTGF